jgi:1-aminocyclopropane-1-carboxylate deaminase/D-cysteine desulfhydrase-like pyridoxal-dependent ACC family enzyme
MDVEPKWLYVSTGSGITAAGLALGFKQLGRNTRVVGVSSSSASEFLTERILQYGNTAAEHLGLSTRLTATDLRVLDQYVGPGYGVATPEVIETVKRVAREEAILLDPVYTGKCMTGLLDQIGTGAIRQGETVVFLHSGGAPNLFAQADILVDSAT